MDNRFLLNFNSLPLGNRIVRYRHFINAVMIPLFNEKISKQQVNNDSESFLHFLINSEIEFEPIGELKNEETYKSLYNLIIENLLYFENSDEVIEKYLLLIDKVALTACVELEDKDANHDQVFSIIKNALWGKDCIIPKPFNTFQRCLFLKLCSIVISNENPVTTKQAIFGKLCEKESWRIGNSIYDTLGFYMPGSDFHGFWKNKNNVRPIQDQVTLMHPPGTIQEMNKILLPGITDTKSQQTQGTTPEHDKIEYAMYYHYLIKANIRAVMGNEKGENGKVDALTKIALLHGFKFKPFQIAFNRIDNDYKQKWITGTEQNLKNFETVIEMLAEYPAAQLLAQNDLKQAEIKGDKRGNPIT